MKRRRTAPSLTPTTTPSSRSKRRKSTTTPKTTKNAYPVRAILDENKSKYLIDWEPDITTGEAYAPTWEPKCNATPDLIADWDVAHKKPRAEREPTPSRQRGILEERDGQYLVALKDAWMRTEDVLPELVEEWAKRKQIRKLLVAPSEPGVTPPSESGVGIERGTLDNEESELDNNTTQVDGEDVDDEDNQDGAATTAGADSGVDLETKD